MTNRLPQTTKCWLRADKLGLEVVADLALSSISGGAAGSGGSWQIPAECSWGWGCNCNVTCILFTGRQRCFHFHLLRCRVSSTQGNPHLGYMWLIADLPGNANSRPAQNFRPVWLWASCLLCCRMSCCLIPVHTRVGGRWCPLPGPLAHLHRRKSSNSTWCCCSSDWAQWKKISLLGNAWSCRRKCRKFSDWKSGLWGGRGKSGVIVDFPLGFRCSWAWHLNQLSCQLGCLPWVDGWMNGTNGWCDHRPLNCYSVVHCGIYHNAQPSHIMTKGPVVWWWHLELLHCCVTCM